MKVTTCLNPLHTALAVTGCLLGYTLIADEMKDGLIVKLIEKIGYDEGLKVVVNPKIIDPKKFIDEVINERLTNPNIPDSPQRIALIPAERLEYDLAKLLKHIKKDKELNTSDLVGIPLALALWCRYLVGIDDDGNAFKLSKDQLLNELKMCLEI